jgi:hypothetical protein
VLTDVHWLEHYIGKTFALTADGRLRATDTGEVPAFVLCRSHHGNLWRLREDLPTQAIKDLARLAGKEPPIQGDVLQCPPPDRLEPMRRSLLAVGLDCEVVRHRLHRGPVEGEVRSTPWTPGDRKQEAESNEVEFFGDAFVMSCSAASPESGS